MQARLHMRGNGLPAYKIIIPRPSRGADACRRRSCALLGKCGNGVVQGGKICGTDRCSVTGMWCCSCVRSTFKLRVDRSRNHWKNDVMEATSVWGNLASGNRFMGGCARSVAPTEERTRRRHNNEGRNPQAGATCLQSERLCGVLWRIRVVGAKL